MESVAARLNCLSRSVPEIHSHVAGTLSNQPTNKQQSRDSNQQLCLWVAWTAPGAGPVQQASWNKLPPTPPPPLPPPPPTLPRAFIPRKTTPVATVPMKLKLFSGNEHSPHAGPKDFNPERDTASFLVCGNGFPWFLVSSSC